MEIKQIKLTCLKPGMAESGPVQSEETVGAQSS